MMRILYIGTPYSVHDIKWATFFSALKAYEVFFVCEQQDIPEGKSETDIRSYYKTLNITYLGSLRTFSISHPMDTLQAIIKLRNLVRENSIELVHILFATPFALWGLFVPCKYMITTRGSDILIVIPDLKKQKGLKGIYFTILYSLFRKAFRNSSKITGTSSLQKQRTDEFMQGGPESLVVRTGVDVDAISSIRNNELLDPRIRNQKFVFSPRYIKPIYNIALQAEALDLLDKNLLMDYWFVFIRGESYDKMYFDALIDRLDKLKADKGLKYLMLDKLTQQQIGTYYKYASLTMMTPSSDGTPNTALEAMAARCPLIIPALAYDELLFKDTCIKLNSYEPAEVAAKINTALNNYPPQMLERAFDAVSKFGNRKVEMMKLNDIYAELNKMN